MKLREMLGFGPRVVVTENLEDVIGLPLMEPNLRGGGRSESEAEMNLIKYAREIRAIVVYKIGVSSRPGLNKRRAKFTYFGRAYGPRNDS